MLKTYYRNDILNSGRVNIVRLSNMTNSVMGWDVAHERITSPGFAIQYCVRCCIKEAILCPVLLYCSIHYEGRDFLMKKINTKTMVMMALFAAVSIVLGRFLVIYLSNSVRISFGNIPVILAGLLLGPLAGALTGAISDILGALLFSPLSWYPPLTISPMLAGLLPALLKPCLLKDIKLGRIFAIILITDVITSIGITTYLLSGLYGTGYLELLAIRAPLSIIIAVIESIVVYWLYKRLKDY